MQIHEPNVFVFTGGGGTGKTVLLEHLRAPGATIVSEKALAGAAGCPLKVESIRLLVEIGVILRPGAGNGSDTWGLP